LLTSVGHAYNPATAGNGGFSRGWPAVALQRVEQGGFLAADVGPGASVHDHVEIEPGAEDVLAQVAYLVGLPHGVVQPRITCSTSPRT
jgi:hypothetical protein